ncbi:MAG: hypothetical protein B7Y45_10290 [Sphingomonas sp. 28-66-16]|nr:MAG: hypothetical protein B7Y45_10290 [Sphingomonas sp. 28-66-16]
MFDPTFKWCDPFVELEGSRMGQERHGGATTTHALRVAIQRSQASLDDCLRGGSVCLYRLAVRISGSPLVDHAAARSGCSKYIWSGVRPPSAECGLTAL